MTGPLRFARTTSIIAVLTLASRILGLLRESALSYYFGAGGLLSAFRVAFQIPNLARRLFGEGAFSSAMVPVLTLTLQTEGEAVSRTLSGTVLTLLSIGLSALCFAGWVVLLVWRGFSDDPALFLTAIMLPYMVLICVSAVASGLLNVRGHFAVPAAAPTILNVANLLALIGGSALAGLRGPSLMYLLCVSVVVAGLLQVVITALALRQVDFFPRFRGTWNDPRLKAVWVLMAPMALGLSAVQINTFLDSIIAYLFIIVDGERRGTAVLGFAQVLYQLPLGVYGISLATAIFPIMSAKAANNDRSGLAEVFERGLRMSLFVGLPAAVGLILVARPLVAAIYEHGEFRASETVRVAGTLVFYSLGLPAYFAQHIVVRAFYAVHDSGTPARAAAAMVVLNLAMNLGLVFVMEERGLALSTSICSTLQVIWLMWRWRRHLPDMSWRRLAGDVGRIVAATGLMAAVLLVLTTPALAGSVLPKSDFAQLAVLVPAGVVAYVIAAWALRVRDLVSVLRTANH